MLGRLRNRVLEKPCDYLLDGSYLTWIYQDQDHQRGERMLTNQSFLDGLTVTFIKEIAPQILIGLLFKQHMVDGLAPTENDAHPVLSLFAGLLPALTKKWVIHS